MTFNQSRFCALLAAGMYAFMAVLLFFGTPAMRTTAITLVPIATLLVVRAARRDARCRRAGR